MLEGFYEQLVAIHRRPAPFAFYTAEELWTNAHIADQMLRAHLAPFHDRASYRTEMIEAAVDWMVDRFGLGTGARIADFGCGPGLYATRLAARGADVTAVDFSKNSLRYAETIACRQGLSIQFEHCNYLSFASASRFDLILLISCDFGAMSPFQRSKLLRIFVNHLAEGGAVVLDVWSLNAFAERQEATQWAHRLGNGFWAAEEYYGFQNTYLYPEVCVALDKFSIVTSKRNFTIYNWDQYFDQAALAQEFAAQGLTITEWYASIAGAPYDGTSSKIAVVAHRSSRQQ